MENTSCQTCKFSTRNGGGCNELMISHSDCYQPKVTLASEKMPTLTYEDTTIDGTVYHMAPLTETELKLFNDHFDAIKYSLPLSSQKQFEGIRQQAIISLRVLMYLNVPSEYINRRRL